MAFVNVADREVNLKIVYYGAALCGKTTNLQTIHGKIRPVAKGNMVSVATSGDRTLFFDFMPLVAEAIKGYRTRFHLYTVPGQVYYNETRKLVLRGVDGVVFVADSQWPKMAENSESLENLESNLREQGLSLETLPYVLQYNKRDLPNVAPVHYLEYLLNGRETKQASMTSVASSGEGVFECLNMVCRLVLHKFIKDNSRGVEAAGGNFVLA